MNKEVKLIISECDKRVNVFLFDNNHNFYGCGRLKEISSELLELVSVVARKGYGKQLYDNMLMYSNEKNKYMCSSRDGDTREGSLSRWNKIYNDNNIERIEISEDYLDEIYEFTDKEESPVLFFAYNKKIDSSYNPNYKVEDKKIIKYVELSEDIFSSCYENEDNGIIDKYYPIKKNIKKRLKP